MVLGGETAAVAEPTPIDVALDGLSTSLDHLVKLVEDGGLDCFDNSGLLDFARSFERVRNRLPLVDHRLITYPGAPHSFFDRKATDFAAESAAAWDEVLAFIRARTA